LPEEAKRGDEQKSLYGVNHTSSIGQNRQHGLTSVGESLPFFVEANRWWRRFPTTVISSRAL
jgi:hypothetical protein